MRLQKNEAPMSVLKKYSEASLLSVVSYRAGMRSQKNVAPMSALKKHNKTSLFSVVSYRQVCIHKKRHTHVRVENVV